MKMHLIGTGYISVALTIVSNVFLAFGAPTLRADDLSLVILHNNDMHGRFEETEPNSGTCQDINKNKSCVGGFARTAHVIRQFRQRAQEGTSPPVLYLNAGDTFVGTSWFSVFTWNISSVFMNVLQPDAISLGNHEFDMTYTTLAPFVNAVTSPIISANLDFSQEPSLQSINKSVILEVSGRKIGVIGYLTPETILISSVGKVIFEDEVTALRREAQELANQGIDIIIALGHSGYEMDKKIAQEVELVDVVVGGHTNTFLWNGAQPSTEVIEDPYPKVITQASGKRVPVVQAYAYTKYLGVLNCTFDANGDLTYFAGQPILLDSSIPQENDVLELLEIYRPAIDALNQQIIGTSRVTLDGSTSVCRHAECNFGNLITDAIVSYVTSVSTELWTGVPIAMYNGGGIRNTITPAPNTGEISRGELLGVLPFGNQIIVLTLKGSDLKQMFEQTVRSNGETSYGEFPQVSGIRLVLDMTKPPYSRVVSLKARCGSCDIPVYETVDPEKNYTLATSSFLADGGDGITILSNNAMNKKTQDLGDMDVVADYITKFSPVYPEVEGRVTFVTGSTDKDDSGNYGHRIGISWSLVIVGFALSRFLILE